MKITTNKLFLGILLFGLITIFLVLFNIQLFYLRAIFSFIFLTAIPGLLIMLMLKIRKIGFWEYSVYAIGLSIVFLMFAGLAVNWILPWLHVTNKPLSLIPLITSFDIILSIFGLIAFRRNKKISFKIKFPKFNKVSKVFLITPIIFPILSILGAITLNNSGSNYLTMITLVGIAICVFLIVLFRDKLNEHIYPWIILLISVSLLLMWWLRSWYISGVDTNVEYHIFQLIKEHKYWSMSLFNSAYNACLSVSILPTIYSIFLKINDLYIFKLIIPLLFSMVSVVVYLFLKRYTEDIFAFLAVFFFMSQPDFPSGAGIPIRQEIGLLFFALALLTLFNRIIGKIPKNLLLLAFLFSMIVSHYSTTYIALTLFIFTYLVCFLFRKTEENKYFSKIYKKLNLKRQREMQKKKYYLNIIIVLSCIIFTFLWYAQLTKISNNFVDFTNKSIQNMKNVFSDDVRQEQTSIFGQFSIFYKQDDPTLLLQNYIKEVTYEYKNIPSISLYPQNILNGYSVKVIFTDLLPLKTNTILISTVYLYEELILKLVKLLIIMGLLYIIFLKLKKQEIDIEYVSLTIFSLLGLLAVMIFPFASITYDITRTYQQMLVLLALPAILGSLILLKFINKNILLIFISIVFLSYFLLLSGFITQIIEGTSDSMQLTNNGENYEELYTHESEIKSANWLFSNEDKKDLTYADERGSYKLWLANNANNRVIGNIFPSTLDTNAYVYLSYSNIVGKKAYIDTRGQLISYVFPSRFLNINKNLIYNNGTSGIYK